MKELCASTKGYKTDTVPFLSAMRSHEGFQTSVIDQTFVSPLDSYVEILTLNVTVLGGGALGRW